MRWALPIVVSCACGCYASHSPEDGVAPRADAGPSCDAADRPVCVEPGGGCDPWRIVDTLCADDLTWRCPPGASEHARVEDATCTPFRETYERLGAIGPEIPIGHACAILANGEVSTLGRPFEHLATPMGVPVPFGSCPSAEGMPAPLLDRSFLPPDVVVDVMATIVVAGGTWSMVRLFVIDPDGGFGVTALGSSWVGHAPDGSFAPTPDLLWADPVTRSAVVHEGFVYLYSSSGEPGLSAPARLARAPIDRFVHPSDYEPVGPDEIFVVGPHFAVTHHAPSGRFVLTTIEGFGETIVARSAPAPEGPWSAATGVHRCELPAGDPEAFCDNARVLASRLDPTRPDELVLGYRIGTLTPGWETRAPLDLWPRVVRAALPR